MRVVADGLPVFGLGSKFDSCLRYVEPDPVALTKRLPVIQRSIVTGTTSPGFLTKSALSRPFRAAEADDRILQDQREAVGIVLRRRILVDQLRRVETVSGASVETKSLTLIGPDDLDIFLQRLGLEDQHVGAARQR